MIICTEESRFDDDDVFRGLRVDSLPTTLPTSVRWAGVDSERPLLTGRWLITAGREVVDFSWFSAASDSLILLYTRDSNRKHFHHLRFNESSPGEQGSASFPSVVFLHLFQKRTFEDKRQGFFMGCSIYLSFGQGSSLLWTHTLRPFIAGPLR